MKFLGQVYEPQPLGPSAAELRSNSRARRGALAGAIASVRRAPEIGGLVGISALLNLWALGRNGWANTYYSAAVRSMASSWHNFLYASFDPSGVMTVDKPPLSLWVQTLSVRVFGFHPLSILVPQALMGVASVVLVYDLVRRRFGRVGGAIAGLALATTPIAVAMSRDNNPDALLTLCCLAAIWFAVRAFEDGRTRWLVLSGIAVGLGFETKMLVALVVVPGIALAWLYAAPRGRIIALRQLLAGGAAMLATAAAWPLLVILTPAADRPYISGTADNSVLSLIFGYNGFGRVTGQAGGPAGLRGSSSVFGQGTGLFRLLNATLAGQDGWLLGAAIAGAAALLVASRLRRRDPRAAWVIVVGGAFLATGLLFSFAQGIFHPYYVVLLAPFTAALVGAGAGTAIASGRAGALAGAALLAGGVICELVVLGNYPGQLRWLEVVLPIVCGVAAVALFVVAAPRARALALGVGAAALMIAPAIWSVDTLGYATDSTFPAGGPAQLASFGGGFGGGGFGRRFAGGFNRGTFRPNRGGAVLLPAINGGGGPPAALPGGGGSQPLFGPGAANAGFGTGPRLFGSGSSLSAEIAYVRAHGGGTIVDAGQNTVALAIIDSDARVAGIGGFTGQESDPSIGWLAAEVASGRIRWVDDNSGRGGFAIGNRPGASAALAAATRVCTPVAIGSGTLYDCAGKAAALRALS